MLAVVLVIASLTVLCVLAVKWFDENFPVEGEDEEYEQ